MKKLICLIVILFGMSCLVEAQTNVPATVTEGFTKKFPTAKKVKWEKENDTEYEATFKMDGKSLSAIFNNHGSWMETEWEVRIKELPEAVVNVVTDKYPGFKIDMAEYCETPDFTGYEMEIEKKEGKLSVEFGENHNEPGNTQTEKAGGQSQMSAKFEKIIFKLNIMFWMQGVTIALILSIITFIIWDRRVGKKNLKL